MEPNDINPQNIDFEESIVGELSSTTDIDKYALDTSGAGTITVSFSSALRSSDGWEVQLVDSANNILSATICDSTACQTGISIPVGVSAAGTYTIVIKSESQYYVADGTYTVSASYSTVTDGIEFEPNNSSNLAHKLELPFSIIPSLSSESDKDWFSFSITQGRIIEYDFSTPSRSSTSFTLSIFDSSLNLLQIDQCAGNCLDDGLTKVLALVVAGEYYVVVESSNYRFSNAQYQLAVKSLELPDIPNTPVSLAASNETTQDYIQLGWPHVADATSYELYRGVDQNDVRYVLDIEQNSYADVNVVPNNNYFYWIKAKNIAGVSALSEYAVGRLGNGPSEINDVQISSVGVTEFTLTWSSPTDPYEESGVISGYDLRYSNTVLTSSNWNNARSIKPGFTPKGPGLDEQYVLSGLSPNSTYWIGIKSVSSRGLVSDISNIAVGTTSPILKINPEEVTLNLQPNLTRNTIVTIENLSDSITVDYVLSLKGKGASVEETPASSGTQITQTAYQTNRNQNLSAALLENHSRWIVKIKSQSNKVNTSVSKREVNSSARTAVMDNAVSLNGVLIREIQNSGLQVWQFDNKDQTTLKSSINTLNKNDNIEYIEPDYKLSIGALPDDPKFNDLWGLVNLGQDNGVLDADIDAEQAWDITTGSKGIIVAVIDTGIDYEHSDLVENIWVNPGEIANNGVDDDGNGFIDDINGYNFIGAGDSDPLDDNDHGTHCAGTIGAMVGNSFGVVGVNHKVALMGLKFLSGGGSGYISDAIESIYYGVDNGARVLSNSWGRSGGTASQTMLDAITYAANNDVLFVAAAGNSSSDNDTKPHWPSNYDVPNVISVAATTREDKKASFSCFGQKTVHLGAPGRHIMSTIVGNEFASFSGTSMATPHVAGAAGLLLANNPSLSALEVKQLLLDSVDKLDDLSGITITGGRLNIHKALLADKPNWMSIVSSKTGSLGPGESVNIDLTIDTTGLTLKAYEAQLAISLENPFVARRFVPIAINVAENDANATSVSQSLSAPENVRVTSKRLSTSIDLAWSESSGASSYDIYRSTNSADVGPLITSVTSTSYSDTAALADTGYYYTISSKNTSYSIKADPIFGLRTDRTSDIVLAEAAGAESLIYVGDSFTQTLTYRNNGQYQILYPRLKFETPDNTSLASITPSSGSCEKIDNSTHCVFDQLASSDMANVEVTFSANIAGESSILYAATSDVSDPIDQDLSNNTILSSFEILDKSDIQVSLTKISSPVENVNIREFNTTVRNNGPSIARKIMLLVKYTGVSDLVLIPDRGNCSLQASGEFNCAIGELEKNENSNLYVKILGNEVASLEIVAAVATDILLSNNTITHEVTSFLDNDGDGVSDANDPDDDNDGISDDEDAFPNDPTESSDADSDGVGDNSDAFPNDATETADSDSDGMGDNSDAFPNNALYKADSDSDGMPDAWETKYGLDPNDASDATSDQDNDGVTALDEFLAGTIPSGSLDIDGNAQYDALTDGLLLLRGMFGLDGDALVTGTVASDALYTESVDIESRIATLGVLADIDGNGTIDALTDGLLTLRYLFGLQGETLINGVVADDATRTSAEEIEAHLGTLMPAL